jgi:hypothetical protein
MQAGTLEAGREGGRIARQHAVELFDARLRRISRTIAHGGPCLLLRESMAEDITRPARRGFAAGAVAIGAKVDNNAWSAWPPPRQ